jgi:hypothetical protein
VTLIRIRLVALAFVVLACQAAAFSAAPIALQCGALSADADLDECCRNLRPGQTCPMHHTTHGTPGPRGSAWTCLCSPSDAVLASLVGVSGALPAPIRMADPVARIATVVMPSSTPLEYQQPPSYPPPRISSDLSLV